MMRRFKRLFPAGVGVILLVAPLLAQRGILAKFDANKAKTLNGVVTRLDWANPHVHILMNVQEGPKLVNWAVELESQLELERSGWNRDSVKPGDSLTVQGKLARDGSQQLWGDSVVLTKTGKKVLAMSPQAVAFFRPVPNARP